MTDGSMRGRRWVLGGGAAALAAGAAMAVRAPGALASSTDILSDYFNAQAVGATGNGTTNDQPALQTAINDAIGAHGNLYVPAGTYLLDAPLLVSAPLRIMGSGRDRTTFLLASGVNDAAFKFSQAAGAITGADFCDFTINGNAGSQSGGDGISAVGAVQCTFERIHFTSVYNWGLALQAQPGGAFGHHNRVIGCTFDGAAAAGYGGGVWTTSSDENFFYGCDFEYLGGTASPVSGSSYPVFFLDQAGLQQITSCCFVGSRGGDTDVIGLRVQNGSQTRIEGCTFDGVGGDNVFIAGTDCTIVGNELTSIGDQAATAGWAAGVHLEYGNARNTVTANNFSSSASTNGKTGYFVLEDATGGGGSNVITANTFHVVKTLNHAVLSSSGTASQIRGNIGYNPPGILTAPALPASGTWFLNPFNVDCMLYLASTGGLGSFQVKGVNGTAAAVPPAAVLLPAGASLMMTYTSAPTWTWFGC